jgi:glycosyltransferase involved in cell wall biosynthesis
MRVTHVITRLIVGGAQENTVASVLGLQDDPDLQVELISGPTAGPEGSLEKVFAGRPQLFSVVPELVRPIHPLKDPLALFKLERQFRERRPDIVHTHSGKAGFLGRLAAKRAGVPIIIHTIHGPSFGEFQGRPANVVFCAAERYVGKMTTHFVGVANAMKEQYVAAGIGEREQHSVIFSGFPLQPFLNATNDPALRARYGIAPDDIVIGKIARLFMLKGHEDLFAVAPEVLKRNPRIKFLLVGDGEWREHFKSVAHSLGLEKHFIFTGLVRPDEIPPLVGIMDFVVHLSRREGLPRSLPQALAASKPVIAFDADGANEVCLDNKTGFLIQTGDLTRLTVRLLQLAGDPVMRERFGRNGRQLVRDDFAVEKMVADLRALYLRLGSRVKR